MGQAKARRQKFGGEVHAVAQYAEAEVVVALIAGKKRNQTDFAVIEAVAARLPSVFNPDATYAGAEEFERVIEGIDMSGIQRGHFAILDLQTMTVKESLSPSEFEADHVLIEGTQACYYKMTGEPVSVGLRYGGAYVTEGGAVIDDPIAFSRGKVRTCGTVTIPADWALCNQVWMAPGGGDALAAVGHLLHMRAAVDRVTPVMASMSSWVNADCNVAFSFLEEGDGFMPLKPEDAYPPLAFFATIVSMNDLVPQAKSVIDYCLKMEEPLALFRARAEDDPGVWKDFEFVASHISTVNNEPVIIGKDAHRTSFELGAALAYAPERFERLEEFFERGSLTGHASVPDGSSYADLFDFGDQYFLTVTQPGDLKEIITWPKVREAHHA